MTRLPCVAEGEAWVTRRPPVLRRSFASEDGCLAHRHLDRSWNRSGEICLNRFLRFIPTLSGLRSEWPSIKPSFAVIWYRVIARPTGQRQPWRSQLDCHARLPASLAMTARTTLCHCEEQSDETIYSLSSLGVISYETQICSSEIFFRLLLLRQGR